MKAIYNSTQASYIFNRACARLRDAAFETACLMGDTRRDVASDLRDLWLELCALSAEFSFPANDER